MKPSLKYSLLALASCTFATTAHAGTSVGDFDLSANVGVTSDYVFRGISQSNEGPALQGGFDVSHASGLYAGFWGSNVDFNDATLETDFYAGFSNTVGNFSYDVGGIYYAYPGSDDNLNYNFYEISAAAGYDFGFLSTSASVNYSPEYFGDSGHAEYYALSVDVPLPYDIGLNAHVGHQDIEENASFGTPDYNDWGLGLSYNLQGFDLGVSYTDTDLDEPAECADGCSPKILFSLSKSF